jgi:hypothetical protein
MIDAEAIAWALAAGLHGQDLAFFQNGWTARVGLEDEGDVLFLVNDDDSYRDLKIRLHVEVLDYDPCEENLGTSQWTQPVLEGME